MALVSVIVPVYNAANTIRECIDSIIAQSFSDFELLIADDGCYCNPTCMACTIFPLCHGGCSQSKLESANPNGCVKGFSERDKQVYVVQRIKGIIAEQYKKGGSAGNNV